MMKKIFFIGLLVLGTFLSVFGNDEKIVVTGTGRTQVEAVRIALKSAIEQKYGLNMTAVDRSQMFSEESYLDVNSKENSVHLSNDRLARDIKTLSKGRINGYRILSQEKDPQSGETTVMVEVIFPGRYVVGNDPDQLRRMAVAHFRINTDAFSVFGVTIDSVAWERAFSSALHIYLTQTRKFTMLDRDFGEEANAELAQLNDPNASPRDAIRIGQKLATDYLVVGTITFNQLPPLQRNPFTGKVMIPDEAVFATINYRVILAATGQLKWADSVQIDGRAFFNSLASGVLQESADYAAGMIGNGIISCILPYEIVGFNPDGTVIIGEGGKTFSEGEFLSVYNTGAEIKDSRTGVVIDVAEMRVGMVQVIRKTEKLTYAVIVEGKLENMKTGARLRLDEFIRRAVSSQQPQQENAVPAGTVQTTTNGGVVVPF